MQRLPFNLKVNTTMFETTNNCQTIADMLNIDVNTIHNVEYRSSMTSEGRAYFVKSVIVN